ncbi:hypothetical protein ACH5RR_038972 [Cinchona calisaya]|uniref:Uncharacterized protein n=1 Tax=Cinchona calisaya TaxID=153742 RepID=A0ABD2Y2E5_9GENT
MELQLTFRAPTAATTAFWGCNKCGVNLCDVAGVSMKKRKRTKIELVKVVRLTTTVERGGGREAVNGGGGGGGGYTSSAMEVTTFNQRLRSAETEFLVWKNIGAVVRLSYGIGIYVTMALAGRFICSMTGIDCTGGFDPSLDSIVEGLGYAAPPIMAILFILDEVVKSSPHARAIWYVEDEEVRSFYYGMSPWPLLQALSGRCFSAVLLFREHWLTFFLGALI